MGRNRKTGKRIMYRSKEYISWLHQFGLHCLVFRSKKERGLLVPITGDFRIQIFNKRRRRGDMDNLSKALLDALQHYRIIENDSQCAGISMEYTGTSEACKIVLTF